MNDYIFTIMVLMLILGCSDEKSHLLTDGSKGSSINQGESKKPIDDPGIDLSEDSVEAPTQITGVPLVCHSALALTVVCKLDDPNINNYSWNIYDDLGSMIGPQDYNLEILQDDDYWDFIIQLQNPFGGLAIEGIANNSNSEAFDYSPKNTVREVDGPIFSASAKLLPADDEALSSLVSETYVNDEGMAVVIQLVDKNQVFGAYTYEGKESEIKGSFEGELNLESMHALGSYSELRKGKIFNTISDQGEFSIQFSIGQQRHLNIDAFFRSSDSQEWVNLNLKPKRHD